MRKNIVIVFMLSIMLQSCGQKNSQTKQEHTSTEIEKTIEVQTLNPAGSSISTRFNPPIGYNRKPAESISFANYLRSLPLKPDGSLVTFYDGRYKPNRNVYAAVVDLPIGKRDLHQCADAVMRLRADYLFQNKKHDSIHFNFTNGFKADYTNWRKGKRIVVKGNQITWKQSATPSDSSKDFWKYLEMVFSYAGTASLSKELKPIPLQEIRIGDIRPLQNWSNLL